MSIQALLDRIDPEIYQRLKQVVELGKWADGQPLSAEQRELCLQAVIAWENQNLPEDQRVGYIAQQCKSSQPAEPADQPEASILRFNN